MGMDFARFRVERSPDPQTEAPEPLLHPERIDLMKDMKKNEMTPRGERRIGPPRGFTLVEVIYVVILLGILAGFAAPFINVAKFRMNSAVIEVATELMSAQRYAVLRGHDVVIAFDEENRWMRVHLDANNNGVVDTGENTRAAQLGDGVSFGRAAGATLTPSTSNITFTQTQGPLKSLTFHRNGSASEMGIIYLTFERSAIPKSNRAVEVIRSTAKVKCWSYDSENWQETC
jgi:prepilin-type N-terminal cleavage/methylation domain-containing protein